MSKEAQDPNPGPLPFWCGDPQMFSSKGKVVNVLSFVDYSLSLSQLLNYAVAVPKQPWPITAVFLQKFILQKQVASLIKPVGHFAHPCSRDTVHQTKLDLIVLETKTFPLTSKDSLILS